MSFRSTMVVKNITISILITMFISVGMSTGLLEDYELGEHLRNRSSVNDDKRPLLLSNRDSIIHRVRMEHHYNNLLCFKDLDHCTFVMHWNTFKKNILMTVRYINFKLIRDSINNGNNLTQIYLLQDQLVEEPKNDKKHCRSGSVSSLFSICDYIVKINMNGNNPTKNCYHIKIDLNNRKNVPKTLLVSCKKIFYNLEKLSVPMNLTTVSTFKYFYQNIDLKL